MINAIIMLRNFFCNTEKNFFIFKLALEHLLYLPDIILHKTIVTDVNKNSVTAAEATLKNSNG